MSDLNMHYVCTRQEARAIFDRQERFWVSTCGCRARRPEGCGRSRHDVCLAFAPGDPSGGGGTREITRAEVEAILQEAEARHLVMRPFRDDARANTVGFCVCCDDCCAYFLQPEENPCDKGALVQSTDAASCNDCGDCTQVCYFGARKIADGKLALNHEACYGCGLCNDVCPTACITMVPRGSE